MVGAQGFHKYPRTFKMNAEQALEAAFFLNDRDVSSLSGVSSETEEITLSSEGSFSDQRDGEGGGLSAGEGSNSRSIDSGPSCRQLLLFSSQGLYCLEAGFQTFPKMACHTNYV